MLKNLQTQPNETKALLSSLWIFILLNMLFRDIHHLAHPGYLEQMMTGVVDGTVVSDGLLVAAGIMLQIPLMMIVLSRLLDVAPNRWANIAAGALTIVMIAANNTAPDPDDILFAAIEILAAAAIIFLAWRLKPTQ